MKSSRTSGYVVSVFSWSSFKPRHTPNLPTSQYYFCCGSVPELFLKAVSLVYYSRSYHVKRTKGHEFSTDVFLSHNMKIKQLASTATPMESVILGWKYRRIQNLVRENYPRVDIQC